MMVVMTVVVMVVMPADPNMMMMVMMTDPDRDLGEFGLRLCGKPRIVGL
jgi:hypothetical protein